MSGSAQFWAGGTWFFLFYGFVVLAIACVRSARMDRHYREAATTNDPGDTAGPGDTADEPDEGR